MNLISVILSIFAASYLEPKWVVVGLAGIFTFHYFIGTGISFYLISRHQIKLPVGSILFFYLKLISIFTLVVAPLWFFRDALPGGNIIQLITVIAVSAFFFLVIAKLLKITEVTSLIKVITGRRD
jgi:putative peptidoglycan lipid II flippase